MEALLEGSNRVSLYGLVGATLLVRCARALLVQEYPRDAGVVRLVQKEETVGLKKKKAFALLLGLVLGFLLICGVGIYFRIPNYLQSHMDGALLDSKSQARRECTHAGMGLQPPELVRNLWIQDDKQLSSDLGLPQNWWYQVGQYSSRIVFDVGVFFAVLPYFAVLAFQLGLGVFNKRLAGRVLPTEADWAFVLLPTLYSGVAGAWVSWAGFQFFIRNRSALGCTVASYHWYTVGQTIFSLLATWLLLRFECNCPNKRKIIGTRRWIGIKSKAAHWYVLWFVMYLVLAYFALSFSKQYYHDVDEGVAGITAIFYVLPFSTVSILAGFAMGIDVAEVEELAAGNQSGKSSSSSIAMDKKNE